MIINVKMPTIVGILTFMSMINFGLGWVEPGKGFITSGHVLGQQNYRLPKIKIIIGHPKTSSKQILMFCQTSRKISLSYTCVVGAQKSSLGEMFF